MNGVLVAKANMNSVFFSIIVPLYNVAYFLRDCIDSIIKQQFESFEIILVDDGSTDDSPIICKEYAAKNSKIKYFRKENGGLSSARNFGIKKASGCYLIFVDSDDFLIGFDFLSKMYELIKKNTADLIMYLPLEYSCDLSEKLVFHNSKQFLINKPINAKYLIDDIYTETCHNTMAQTKIIKKDYLLDNNIFFKNGTFHEDDEWLARTLLKYPNVVISDIVGYGYRHREDSIISTKNHKNIFKKCCDRIKIADTIINIDNILNHTNVLTYFIYYYIQAFNKMNDCKEYADQFLDIANQLNVIDAMKYSNNKKHRVLYWLKKILGVKVVNKIILKYSLK